MTTMPDLHYSEGRIAGEKFSGHHPAIPHLGALTSYIFYIYNPYFTKRGIIGVYVLFSSKKVRGPKISRFDSNIHFEAREAIISRKVMIF